MKRMYCLIALIAILYSSNAQDLSYKFIHTIGYTYFTDGKYANAINNDGDLVSCGMLNIATGIYSLHFIPYQISDNLAVKTYLKPSVGVWFGTGYMMSVNVPLMIGIDAGAGSTYKTTSDIGGFLALGYEYNLLAINALAEEYPPSLSFMQPVISTGIRFWIRDKLAEVSLKVGVGKKYEGPDTSLTALAFKTGRESGTVLLSYSKYLNY